MARKPALALLLALVLALPHLPVHALALGDIQTRSALNQPLDAEIPILAARVHEIDGLVVTLADAEAFEAAGLERPFMLTRLRFTVDRDARGLPRIRVRTREPVREPFLTFIIEATWPQGRLLREYTILLDPPVTTAEAPPAVAAPVQPAPAPAPEAAPAVASVPAAPAGAAMAAGSRYGPVRRNETLWTIANRLRPADDVTVEQMMLALLEANPEAFVAGNINRLKAGYVLRVPAAEEVRAIDPAAARAEVRRQMAAWRAARRRATQARAGAGGGAQPRLRLVAPEAGPEVGRGAVAEAAPGTGSPGEAGAGGGEAAPAAGEAQALQARIAELESRLEQMQQLLALKDDELATLQAELRRLRGEAGEARAEAEAPGAGEAAPEGRPAAPGEAGGPPAAGEAGAAGEAEAAGTAAEAGAPAGAGEGAQPPAEEGEATTVAQAPTGANPYARPDFPRVDVERLKARPPATPTPAPSAAGGGGFLEALAANPYTLWAGGAVAVLLAALLLLAIRRRRLAEEDFQESILTQQPAAGAGEGAASEAAATEPTPARAAEGESALISDFATSDLTALETETEADPIAEADVYLAYGRYRQAETLVREAIEREPERLELKIKLLEILHAAGDRTGFEGVVAEHQEALTADEAVWARVLSMGRALAPDNPLFAEAEGAGAGPGEAAPAAGGSAEVELADIELGELEQAPAESGMPEPEESLDFDLGEPEAVPGAEGVPEAAEGAAEPAEGEAEETSEGAGGLEDTGTIEWEAPEIEPPEEAGEAAAERAEPPLPGTEATPEAPEGEAAAPSAAEGEGAPAPEGEAVAGGLASDEDEVATKLDLARAYMEMGDPDGARELLEEVVAEGNEAQREEAESLLKQLG